MLVTGCFEGLADKDILMEELLSVYSVEWDTSFYVLQNQFYLKPVIGLARLTRRGSLAGTTQ